MVMRRDYGGTWCPPPRRWWMGLGALAMAMACVAGSRTGELTNPPGAAAQAGGDAAQVLDAAPEREDAAPAVSPLIEPSAELLAASDKPKPKVTLPFDNEQLERIYAVQDIVAAASAAHGVEPALINALIWVESKFDRRARGPAGAQGLMQLMPKTAGAMAKRLGRKRDSYDPDFNIHAGTLLLSRLLDRFEGDVTLALAGYNRGGGTVSKWVAAGEPLPAGAQGFADRVFEARAWFERLPSRPKRRPASTPKPAAKPTPSTGPISRVNPTSAAL
ncbi:Soluble lytic murein transglycosylase [Enhygromyxa salina]|uniref:Soluble lytic murein transglycosylase n=1 Tax=Enhygromyxa salina TaxID=215803 RepID=A0A0C1ZSX1_9BACT|nr:Soluble lytic murein transglycosylase [Enhygromyxa salina]